MAGGWAQTEGHGKQRSLLFDVVGTLVRSAYFLCCPFAPALKANTFRAFFVGCIFCLPHRSSRRHCACCRGKAVVAHSTRWREDGEAGKGSQKALVTVGTFLRACFSSYSWLARHLRKYISADFFLCLFRRVNVVLDPAVVQAHLRVIQLEMICRTQHTRWREKRGGETKSHGKQCSL